MNDSSDVIQVLHVDDDSEFAEMAAESLEREDDRLSVTSATSVKEGLALVQGEQVDCIVSDYDMTEMDGIAFLERVRETHPYLPFILFTGKGSEEVASQAISAGATDYLQKGTGLEIYTLLANRIRNAFEHYASRQQAEIQRQQYQELFEKAPVMYIVTRVGAGEPIIEFCNQYFADKLGYEREHVIGRSAYDFYTEESEQAARSGGLDRAMNADFFREERHLLRQNGDEITAEVQAAPRYDDEGTVIGVLTLFFDVTAHRERQQELEVYQTMVDTVPDGVYALDNDLRYIAVNQGLAELTGYETEELVGTHVSKILDEADLQAVESNRRKLLDSDEGSPTQVGQYRIQTAKDRAIPCEVRFRALPAENGFQGTAGVIRDISERLEQEETLKRQNERLEAFASVVSHDLRNPLNVARGRLELARDDHESEHLDEIGRALARMETMIDDLLSLARSGEIDESADVDLAEIVRSAWSNVQTEDTELIIDTALTLRANRKLLQQLLENLMRNAVQHGGASVTVTIGDLEEDTGFFVADDGPGIPASDHEKAFEVGYSKSATGTGLGLRIAESIAEAHDWEIALRESRSGGAQIEIAGVNVVDQT